MQHRFESINALYDFILALIEMPTGMEYQTDDETNGYRSLAIGCEVPEDWNAYDKQTQRSMATGVIMQALLERINVSERIQWIEVAQKCTNDKRLTKIKLF